MRYKRYGKGGPMVSRLGFGAMRLPLRKRSDLTAVNFRKSVAVIRQSLDAGVNFVDSQHHYHGGHSEEAIGRALKGWKGHRVCIQTKSPFYHFEWPIDHFKRLLHEALEKMHVDAIDYLLFHAMSMDSFKKVGKKFLRFTDWALQRGLIRNRGFSSHDSPENVRKLIDTGEFQVVLLSYNWMSPDMRDTIAHAAGKGMGVSVMNPLGGGLLGADTPPIRRLIPGSKSSAETALRYVLDTPGVTLALSGMNEPEQVAENCRVASRKTPITAAQRKAMRRQLERLEKRADQVCTACGYCLPCPAGVAIPQNFMLLNQAKLLGLVDGARKGFRRLQNDKEGDKSAGACLACGKCLPKCPTHVPIIRQLQETARLLG